MFRTFSLPIRSRKRWERKGNRERTASSSNGSFFVLRPGTKRARKAVSSDEAPARTCVDFSVFLSSSCHRLSSNSWKHSPVFSLTSSFARKYVSLSKDVFERRISWIYVLKQIFVLKFLFSHREDLPEHVVKITPLLVDVRGSKTSLHRLPERETSGNETG